MSKRKPKKKVNKFIQLLGLFSLLLLISVPFVIIGTQAALSTVSYEVEKLSKEIKTQEHTNESLNMTINELASLDKIQEVAKEAGLSYNNSNIKSIGE